MVFDKLKGEFVPNIPVTDGRINVPYFPSFIGFGEDGLQKLLNKKSKGQEFSGMRIREFDLNLESSKFLLQCERVFLQIIKNNSNLMAWAERANWTEEQLQSVLEGWNIAFSNLLKNQQQATLIVRMPLACVSEDEEDTSQQLNDYADYVYFYDPEDTSTDSTFLRVNSRFIELSLGGVKFRISAQAIHSKQDAQAWLMPFQQDRKAQYWNLEGVEVVQVPEDHEERMINFKNLPPQAFLGSKKTEQFWVESMGFGGEKQRKPSGALNLKRVFVPT
jgi:hypothetical protein